MERSFRFILFSRVYITLYDRFQILTYILRMSYKSGAGVHPFIFLVIVFQLVFTILIQFIFTKQWKYFIVCTAGGIYTVGIIIMDTQKTDSSRILLDRVSEDWRNALNDKCVDAIGLESERKKFAAQLEQLQKRGVALFVDGVAALPDEAAAKAVQEDSPYMADYVLGTAGNIEQIRFDKVTSR